MLNWLSTGTTLLGCALRRSGGSRRLPTSEPGFEPGSDQLGFVVDKVELGQVFSEYLGFLCHSFLRLLHTHHPSSGAGTIGQIEISAIADPFPFHLKRKYNYSPFHNLSSSEMNARGPNRSAFTRSPAVQNIRDQKSDMFYANILQAVLYR
jgi:hypothetical protein